MHALPWFLTFHESTLVVLRSRCLLHSTEVVLLTSSDVKLRIRVWYCVDSFITSIWSKFFYFFDLLSTNSSTFLFYLRIYVIFMQTTLITLNMGDNLLQYNKIICMRVPSSSLPHPFEICQQRYLFVFCWKEFQQLSTNSSILKTQLIHIGRLIVDFNLERG